MRDYILHKIVGIAIPVLTLALILILDLPVHETWRILFIIIIIYAYTHFSVGAFFQLRSYARSENALAMYVVFFLLSFVAIGLGWVFVSSPLVIFSGVFGVGYFMLHGFFNEATLFNRQAGAQMPLSILGAVVIWLTSVAFLGLGHPSALVGPGLSFLSPQVANIILTYSDYAHAYSAIAKVSWFGIFVALMFLIAGFVMYRQRRVVAVVALLTVIMIPITYALYVAGPPSYIFVYFALLGYHFSSWLLYFGDRYRNRKPEWQLFLGLHIALILIFLVPLLPKFSDTPLMEIFYNINTLFMFSLAHITTSFMNEEWFKNRVMPRLWKT